jgi:hypothetical protein
MEVSVNLYTSASLPIGQEAGCVKLGINYWIHHAYSLSEVSYELLKLIEIKKSIDVSEVLMMEAVITVETSVNFYETARRDIPEDRHFHTCRRENLKYHLLK